MRKSGKSKSDAATKQYLTGVKAQEITMLINFWYPVILSSELEDQPKKVRMLGQDFVVFRDYAFELRLELRG